MANVSVCLVHQPLEKLEEIAQRYRGMDLELAVAYISPGGVLNLSQLIKAARCTRITVGIAPINRVVAFRQLQELGAEVFVDLAESGSTFQPKVYYGVNKGLAWAMIGSSNLTSSGLDLNIELNLLIEGQRFTELFTRLEALLEGYRLQAHPLTEDLYRSLEATEQGLGRHIRERDYTDYLRKEGMPAAVCPAFVVPEPLQRQAWKSWSTIYRGRAWSTPIKCFFVLSCWIILMIATSFCNIMLLPAFISSTSFEIREGYRVRNSEVGVEQRLMIQSLKKAPSLTSYVLIPFHVLNVEGGWKPVPKGTTTLSIRH
ncbi:phospholipase D-like domain-containing protein [Thermogemmatispora tikiterensis]|uniref:Uncharacterized protein n=1 Tax=Thermogemmatispora tikiterensis TaxID=1825093 RepID=A0A328VF80_9CHLR|nr:phospholipase D-like domain-containing protein [Thermogemmatispora tikiterensis]RAQ96458.1 hypothetical protein A4R35_13000 [Thermogemmatispora tikiterensis]